MAKLRLTDEAVRDLPLPTSGRVDYFDVQPPKRRRGEFVSGFLVRTSPSAKTFGFVYRVKGDRRRKVHRLTIGTFPAMTTDTARELARKAYAKARSGVNPVAKEHEDVAAGQLSFRALAARYVAEKCSGDGSWPVFKRRTLDAVLVPQFGHRVAADITEDDVNALLDRIAQHGTSDMVADAKRVLPRKARIHANRVHEVIRHLFNWGRRKEKAHLGKVPNPCLGWERHAKQSRDRWLREHEIPTAWRAMGAELPETGHIFKMTLLTGQRPGEVVRMLWSQLSPSTEKDGTVTTWWEIPTSKNGEPHRVPLSRQALALLDELRPITGDTPHVFLSRRRNGKGKREGRSGWQGALERIRERSGLGHWTHHDLRRTASTHLVQPPFNVPPHVVDALQNHVVGGVRSIYQRYAYGAAVRDALTAWGDAVEGWVAKGERKGKGEAA